LNHPGTGSRRGALALAGASLGTLLLASGCITMSSPEIASMKNDIETALDGDFEREVGIRLGRFSIGLGKAILGVIASEDDEELSNVTEMLRGLRKVEVSVYETGELGGEGWRDVARRVESAMARESFTATVRVRDDHELAWVFCRLDEKEQLRAVTVIALDDEQLTLVRLAGRLDRALAAAISLARDAAGPEQVEAAL
jgi:hypothetical protein